MNPNALEQRLREEGKSLPSVVPGSLEERILAATRTEPWRRPPSRTRALAALGLVALAGWWALGLVPSQLSKTDSEPTRTLSTLQQVTSIDVVGETWGSPALSTVEAALLAEVDGWRKDAEEVTLQVLEGIPGPMRRLLFPG